MSSQNMRDHLFKTVSFVTKVFLFAVVVTLFSGEATEGVEMSLAGIIVAFVLTNMVMAPLFYFGASDWWRRRREEREDDLRRYSSD